MNPQIAAVTQGATPGNLVQLFILDLLPIGEDTQFHLSPTNLAGTEIIWGGQSYSYAPIDMSGIEWNANGDPPNPKLMLPNVAKFASRLAARKS